jgi:hypothetical protein
MTDVEVPQCRHIFVARTDWSITDHEPPNFVYRGRNYPVGAAVLAEGYAARLWPITRHRPKMLLPLGETPVIDRILRALENDERIDTIYLSTNEIFADVFAEHVEEMGYETVQLSVE